MASVIIESPRAPRGASAHAAKSVDATEAELRANAVERSLTSAEADVLEELDEIGFLLGDA